MAKYIDELTESTSPAAADLMITEASDLSTEYKVTLSNFMKVINALTALASPDDGSDTVPIYDTTAGSTKKLAVSTFMDLINTLSAITNVASGDSLALWDASAGASKKATMLEVAAGMGRIAQLPVFAFTEAATTGDGKAYLVIPSYLDGLDLIAVHGKVITPGTTGTMDIQIRNVTQTADMLSVKLTIDSAELGSDTAATAYTIDTGNDDVAAYDTIAIDVDAIHTTAAAGLLVTLVFG